MEECRIRGAEEGAGIKLIVGVHTRPDTHADQELALLNEQRLLERANQCAAGAGDIFHTAGALLDDRKLVSAQTGGEAAELGRLAQPLRDALEHEISESVPHAVIYVLEVVEVNKKDADLRAVACRVLERDVQVGQQLPPIRQSCQRIVLRKMLQLARALVDARLELSLILEGRRLRGGEFVGHLIERQRQSV